MYVPSHFAESRTEVLHELIRRHPLGALVAATTEGLEASHVPFEIDAAAAPLGILRCHLARANPLWRRLNGDSDVLVMFQGEDSYISPAWYRAKQEHGKVVPTWNYVTVHAYGKPRVIQDAQWLRALVTGLTDRHESNRAEPWRVTDAPAEYVDKMLQAIVGVEIEIERISGAWKLSQNRSLADREGVARGLAASSAPRDVEMAELVGRTLQSSASS
jgi:transcriptional regulator